MLVLLLSLSLVRAETLDGLLSRGEVTLVETQDDGRVSQVTALARLDAPADVVWARITDFGAYVTWMPQVAKSTVVERVGDSVTVDWSIKVPGPNVSFRGKYTLDPAARTVKGEWVSGALQGSRWDWKVVDEGATTLVYRTTYSSAVSDNWLVSQFDDDSHTLEIGLNAAAPVVELKGLRAALSP